ncbi:MAG: PIN domain-containing protein [Acidimicrobiia bacterium]|nr:PIN domain-containing protein [Acidimicrobiia bacterium]
MNGADLYFVDTNVLLYSCDSSEKVKRGAAREWLEFLWENGTGRLSWQVLHEFYVNAVRKLKTPSLAAQATVEAFAEWQPVETSLGLIQSAWHFTERAQLSYWDALILAAAQRAGCRYLLSEDFQEGRQAGGVKVVNPFRKPPGA